MVYLWTTFWHMPNPANLCSECDALNALGMHSEAKMNGVGDREEDHLVLLLF